MNNYEHILQGGMDAFENALYDRCTCCVRGKQGVCSPDDCRPNVHKWLEAEYIEPDTQERINDDIRKCNMNYWKCSDVSVCSSCKRFGHCYEDKVLDLLARQRRLDGVEK